MIERIETAGPGAKARRLVFDDDLEPRYTSAVAAKRLGLEAGAPVSRSEIEAALGEIEYALAKDRALRLLGYREHSSAELLGKLRDTGYPPGVAAAVVARFADIELVDDRRFAFGWARSRISAGYGTSRIKQELVRRGIGPDLVEDALAEFADPDQELARARAALGRRTATDRAGRDRLIRSLVARGFPLSTAVSAVGEAAEEDSG